MRLLESNYNRVWGQYQDQRNLLISWAALFFGVMSAIVSLVMTGGG